MAQAHSGTGEGRVLWSPSAERIAAARLSDFLAWLARERGLVFSDYTGLWQWSVTDIPAFWRAVARYFAVELEGAEARALEGVMPDAHWFPGATLNYAERLLRRSDEQLALVARREDGVRRTLTYRELRHRVARARRGLERCGVGPGDRVAAILPNSIEAVVGLLAAASLGAIWSSAAPEFGVASVLDRFTQIAPKVLLAAGSYRYGGKTYDRRAELATITARLPSLAACFVVTEPDEPLPREAIFEPWSKLVEEDGPLAFAKVQFEQPLWILYSSGTTGLPKPIVQGHGGILLEHLKVLALHLDLGETDKFFWFSTTGWMMWNLQVSALALGSTLVLFDGSPAERGLGSLWRLAAEEAVTYFGTSAPFLLACKKSGISPKKGLDLTALRSVGTTGAPLPADGFDWVYEHVKADVLLGSVSGGTDVCTAFVLSCPLLPVRAGELQCRGLGAMVEAWDEAGRPLVDEVGELVLREPLPSMPVGFWGDVGGARYRASYFETYPGYWRHGDWIKITPQGGAIIYGRSDSTLKRGGVRMGTSEFYAVVEALPEVQDSLVIDTTSLERDPGVLWLFLVLKPGLALTPELGRALKTALRTQLSPRHVPDEIRTVPEIPRTLNGKKLEVPVKRILLGADAEQVANRDVLQNPDALAPFIALAAAASRA